MGGANVVPGLSGGSVAVVVGVYQDIINALSLVAFKTSWKQHLRFLVLVGVGALVGIVVLAHILEPLLVRYPFPTFLFFMGLIIGGIPQLVSDYRALSPTKRDVVWFVVGALPVLLFWVLPQGSEAEVVTGGVLILSGVLAACAMIIPGISGSFILLLLGSYQYILGAVNQRDIATLLLFGAGAVVGVFSVAQGMRLLLARAPRQVWAAVIALVATSTLRLFPGFNVSVAEAAAGIMVAIAGFCITFYTQRIARPTPLAGPTA